MECRHCKTVLDKDSKFCTQCGKGVNDVFEDILDGIKTSKRFWFIVGSFRAMCLRDKDMKALNEFEARLKVDGVFEDYNDIVVFWKNQLKSEDGIKQ
jgi:hypothetical protein